MQEIGQFSALIAQYGVAPILVAIILVLAREVRREQREGRRWQRLALSLMGEAEKTTALAEFYRGVE